MTDQEDDIKRSAKKNNDLRAENNRLRKALKSIKQEPYDPKEPHVKKGKW